MSGELETEAYVCPSAGAPLVLQKIKLPALTSTQVEIDMECCGLCHTELHMCENDWGIANFPLVPGHEGVGVVKTVGADVKNLKVGDKVGVAWIRDSCGKCKPCGCGKENLCREGYQGTFLASNAGPWGKVPYNEHGGCFSKVMRIESTFAFKIPANLEPEWVAPMMCGGATVWEPVEDYVTPGTEVGVISIGGLGTAAIKLAKLRGGNVTAFSRSVQKKDAILACGASKFVDINDAEAMKAAAGACDVLIDTCPVNQDISPYMDVLSIGGVYCRIGIPSAANQDFGYKWIPTIFTGKKIVGSIVLGSKRMNDMLQIVSENKEFMQKDMPDWKVEVLPFDKVNEAMKSLKKQTNKGWRIVLKW